MQRVHTWTLFLSRFASGCLGGVELRFNDDPSTRDRSSCCMAPPACKRILIESIIMCSRGQRGVSSLNGRRCRRVISSTHTKVFVHGKENVFYLLLLEFLPLLTFPYTPANAFIFHKTGESTPCTLLYKIPIKPSRNAINKKKFF